MTVVAATVDSILKAAISLTKRSQSPEVEPDHVLMACLLSIARFGIARIGSLAVDLDALGIDWLTDAAAEPPAERKVNYSAATVTLLDRAAAICRADHASAPRVAHLLAAFATPEPCGLMARLEEQGIDSAAWRTAIGDFDTPLAAAAVAPGSAGTYVSPEQAAEILGVHHQTIRGYIRSGKLPALRIAGERAVRIRRESLDRLLEPVVSPESE